MISAARLAAYVKVLLGGDDWPQPGRVGATKWPPFSMITGEGRLASPTLKNPWKKRTAVELEVSPALA